MSGAALVRIGRALRPFWANPVVVRDLRAQMRGTKSYWYQALYLLLLGLLAVAGYGSATSGRGSLAGTLEMNVVEVQQRLQQFYYFIFVTLAALICLIGPALTAAAITGERQRMTLDLLVTTPLTAAELLVGKLTSSVAFLLLLLALSLPASALCVMLGGATLGDVFRVYLLLAIDGLVLAAIGLYFSCAVRASLPALVWTYLAVIAFQLVTFPAMSLLMVSSISSMRGAATVSPAACFAVLNPFVAVWLGSRSFAVGGVTLPLWVGAAVVAFLFIRLLLTAASWRMGSYGGDAAIGSLRRQILFLTGVGMALGFYSLLPYAAMGSSSLRYTAMGIQLTLISGFLVAALFLPGLFTPAVEEDAPPGQAIEGRYDLRRAFRPEHAGALPFFHLWLAVLIGGALVGAALRGNFNWETLAVALLTAYYLSGVGFLFWALSRRAATLVRGVSGARALAFGLYALVTALPLMLRGMFVQGGDDSPFEVFWIFYPLARLDRSDGLGTFFPLLWSGTFSYLLGVFAFAPWRALIPAGPKHRRTES